MGGGRCEADLPPPLFRGTEGGDLSPPLPSPPPHHNGHWCVCACVVRRRGRGCCWQPHPRLIGRGHTSLWNLLERGHMTALSQLWGLEREQTAATERPASPPSPGNKEKYSQVCCTFTPRCKNLDVSEAAERSKLWNAELKWKWYVFFPRRSFLFDYSFVLLPHGASFVLCDEAKMRPEENCKLVLHNFLSVRSPRVDWFASFFIMTCWCQGEVWV